MKIRQGFVSNSSSTSFVISSKKNAEEFETWLINVFAAIYDVDKKVAEAKVHRCLDISFGEEEAVEMVSKIVNEGWSSHKARDIEEIIEHAKKAEENIIIINSTGDNSIPYPIQELFESNLRCTRVHWG
jgi:hypothetical protein